MDSYDSAYKAEELPTVVLRYLEERNLVPVDKDEFKRLHEPPHQPEQLCPFELHREKFGWTHKRYLTTIGNMDSGLYAVECMACHNITLEHVVALAAPG